MNALKEQHTHELIHTLLPIQGVSPTILYTQGVALGYKLIGLSARMHTTNRHAAHRHPWAQQTGLEHHQDHHPKQSDIEPKANQEHHPAQTKNGLKAQRDHSPGQRPGKTGQRPGNTCESIMNALKEQKK